MKSSFEFPHEVEDKPPPAGCELGNMKENNLMQREEHSSYFCTLWKQDEVAATLEVRLDIDKNSHPPIIIEESYEPSTPASGKAETKIHEEKQKLLQGICSEEEEVHLP